jgi:hypothetical protein
MSILRFMSCYLLEDNTEAAINIHHIQRCSLYALLGFNAGVIVDILIVSKGTEKTIVVIIKVRA